MADNYEVGYGKPPKATQFAKGCSGNPKGRPKGSVNLLTLVQRHGRRKMTITEGGKKRRIAKLDAIVLQLANLAVSGERHARQQFIQLYLLGDGSELVSSDTSQSDKLQKKLVRSLLKRAERMEDEASATAEQSSKTAVEVPINVIS